ncbi:MAG TPA: hypothetical protein VLI67_02720 [Vicinamibacteria bacterium]|nr:hypothetical protein [Vicinamibacteria bacterium]
MCAVCSYPIELAGAETIEYLEELVQRALPETPSSLTPRDDQYFLIVARGHRDLLQEIEGLVGGMGWVRVIEDRRRDQNLLPREGREGASFGT